MIENENENVEPVSEGAEGKTSRLKNLSKRGKMTAIIVAAVIVIAGFGFWTWHEQPSFCGAICHTPMDAYADTYFTDVNDEDATLVAVQQQRRRTTRSSEPQCDLSPFGWPCSDEFGVGNGTWFSSGFAHSLECSVSGASPGECFCSVLGSSVVSTGAWAPLDHLYAVGNSLRVGHSGHGAHYRR